jgi:hypothetical protein
MPTARYTVQMTDQEQRNDEFESLVEIGSNRLRVWVTNLRSWKTGRAYRNLTNSMKKDRDYANSWQCNIACVLMDEGLDHRKANRIADHLMKHLFNVTDD